MSVKIKRVITGSPAEKAGLSADDVIESINGQEVEDVLDYRFLIESRKLRIKYQRGSKMRRAVIRKAEAEDIGLDFETYLMDKQHCCKNKCMFCFIDQMPEGMRESLYFKDDDSRMSFLFGNYITLTNISEHEIERIIRLHISPVNISVHTTNPELRVRMMKNPTAGDSLKILYRLANSGVKLNCQLVLCPGVNDGDELIRSINDLASLYPSVVSIACVPVGLTRYRERLEHIDGYDRDSASAALDIIERAGDECAEKYGSRIVFASDEFYIRAGRKLPDSEFYGDFDQLDNGVGLCALLKDEFTAAADGTEADDRRIRCTIATGVDAESIMSELVDNLKEKWHNVECTVVPVINDFFGHQITVTGLITGKDLIAQLKGRELGDRLLLSDSMFRSGEDVMLDDVTVSDIEKELNVRVVRVANDGHELLTAILDL